MTGDQEHFSQLFFGGLLASKIRSNMLLGCPKSETESKGKSAFKGYQLVFFANETVALFEKHSLFLNA